MNRGPLVGIGVAVVAVAAAGGFWLWKGAAPAPGAAAQSSFVSPQRRQIAATVLATGVVRLRTGAEVRVGAQLSGIVQKLNVTVGSHISRGDVIAQIDSRGLQARLAQAQAQVGVAGEDVRKAEVELRRARDLDQKKLVAASEVEDKSIALASARARLEKARRDVAVVETDLNYAVIRAPISGTVATVATQEGETVQAAFNTPTFVTIIEDGALELIAMVDETDIGNVAVGNGVTFTVESFPTREFSGRVVRIAPKGTIISGVVNYEVGIALDPGTTLLKPDMTANVSVRTAEREALVLPSEAVRKDAGGRYVYVQQGDKVVRRDVSIGTREGGVTEVRQGVGPGDRVLVGPAPGEANKAGAA